MEIIEINKNRRSIVEITDDERRLILDCLEIYKSKIGKDETYEIDKLKYNVIDQCNHPHVPFIRISYRT